MVWKALEALGMLSEALGSFDVNTVCPLPGSWINHVLYAFLLGFLKMMSIMYAFLQGLLNPAYGNVVFSRSKLRASQQFRAFSFTFAPSCRQSHVLYVNLCIFVRFFAYAVHWVAGSFCGELRFACNFTLFSESRLWNVVFLRCLVTGW